MSSMSTDDRNFIYITDIHLTTKTPGYRTERPIENVIFDKLDYIKELAKKYNSEAIVHGGDLFDKYINSSDLICRISKWICSLDIPFVSVAGNHDIPGKNSSLYLDSSISLISPPIQMLTGDYIDTGNFRFQGYHYDDPRVLDIIEGRKVDVKTLNDPLIGIIHYHVGDGSYMIDVDKLNIQKPFDMVLFGDIHTGFEPRTLPTGVIVANPGALFRKTKSEISRKPKAYVVYRDLRIVPEYLPITEGSFKEDKLAKEQEELGKTFLAILAKAKLDPAIAVEETIKIIAEECGYSKESVEVLLDVLHS